MATKVDSIQDLLREAREAKGMNKSEATRELGVSRQTYYHWEDYGVTPGIEYANRIAEFTDHPLGEVLQILLVMNGYTDYEVYLAEKNASRSGTVRRRNSTGDMRRYVKRAAAAPHHLVLDPGLTMVGVAA